MNLHISQPLTLEHYQEGRTRVRETGIACPECGRYFDNNIWLRGHREAVHGVPDPTRDMDRARQRKSEAKRRKKKGAKAKKRSKKRV